MVRIFTALSATLLAALAVSAAPKAPAWSTSLPDNNGIYVSCPTKDTVWSVGEKVHVSWLLDNTDPHNKDDLMIKLVSRDNTYTITNSTPAQHRKGECSNLGYENKFCAEYHWKIPERVAPGMYQVAVIDATNQHLIRYTNFFKVEA